MSAQNKDSNLPRSLNETPTQTTRYKKHKMIGR